MTYFTDERKRPTRAQIEDYLRRTSNWGRWGTDDQLGTLNLIGPAKRAEAAMLVRSGRIVSLARDFPSVPGRFNPKPALHFMMRTDNVELGSGYATDYLGIDYHGAQCTHIDALSHLWDKSGLWNGRKSDVVTFGGANFGSIDLWGEGILTRGVFFDIPTFRGEPFVTLEKPVHAWDLEDIAAAQRIEIRPGDAVVIYSGREAYDRANPEAPWGSEPIRPGLDATCVQFLREHDVGVLVWDMTETRPNPYGMAWGVDSSIIAHGLAMVDMALLEPLATACAEEHRSEFMLVVSPLRVLGGVGSPVNPLAVF